MLTYRRQPRLTAMAMRPHAHDGRWDRPRSPAYVRISRHLRGYFVMTAPFEQVFSGAGLAHSPISAPVAAGARIEAGLVTMRNLWALNGPVDEESIAA